MNPNDNWGPKDYIKAIYDTLRQNKNYADKVKLGTRCVTIDYAGDFHLDVVPCVTIDGDHYICNRLKNEFEKTNGAGYRDWFNGQNKITDGNLKRVVRLLKYLRDHKGNYTAKSILLTTLAGMCIYPSDKDTEAVKTVADTLETVLTRMDDYLQANPTMPEIRNPVLPSETFNRHWDQRKYAHFRDMLHSHAQTVKEAKSAESGEESIRLWRKLFGEEFGKDSGGGNSGSDGDGSGNNSRSNPKNLGSAPKRTIPATSVRPRKPYASSLATVSRASENRTLPVSQEDIQKLHQEQPGLSFNFETQKIAGKLEVSAEYDRREGLLNTMPHPTGQSIGNFIQDTFDIEIRLEFQPTGYNPWPPVLETAGRIQEIARKRGISRIEDMHCYPGSSENLCCLGIQGAAEYDVDIATFVRELVVPFFYRVAYVDKYGLQAARDDLWGEYSHGYAGYEEYLSELRSMRHTGRNGRCPCGSGLKYKRCHLDEVNAARSMLGS